MSNSPELRRHRLRNIPVLGVDENVFRTRYAHDASMSRCSGYCCRSGVLLDVVERDKILRHADLVGGAMDPAQQHDTSFWFGAEVEDPDVSSGRAVDTQVHNGSCVFLNGDARCVLQQVEMQADPDVGPLKPFFCRAFPVALEFGVLTVDDEHCPFEVGCCGPVEQGSLTIFDLCADELEFVLGKEGVDELRRASPNEETDG